MHTILTPEQKLQALAHKYYQHAEWVPKAGDYYTSSRADLELYRIESIEHGMVFTEYCTHPGIVSDWPEVGFTTEGFGVNRVWVPDFILDPKE